MEMRSTDCYDSLMQPTHMKCPLKKVVHGLQLVRIEEDGAYVGLVGGSPRPKKAVQQRLEKLPVQLDSRDARFVTELVSGKANHIFPSQLAFSPSQRAHSTL